MALGSGGPGKFLEPVPDHRSQDQKCLGAYGFHRAEIGPTTKNVLGPMDFIGPTTKNVLGPICSSWTFKVKSFSFVHFHVQLEYLKSNIFPLPTFMF